MRGSGLLLHLIRRYFFLFKKQGPAVQSQHRAFFLTQVNQLLCFLGQTAQLTAFSAAGFGFPPDIIGEEYRYVVQTRRWIDAARFFFCGPGSEGKGERDKEGKEYKGRFFHAGLCL